MPLESLNRQRFFPAARRNQSQRGLVVFFSLVILIAILIGLMIVFFPPGFTIRFAALPIAVGFIGFAWALRSGNSGLPGRWTCAVLLVTIALSVLWPRYIFFSIGGPFVNPLTIFVFLSVLLSLAWIAYSPALTEKMGSIANGARPLFLMIAIWYIWRLVTCLTGEFPWASAFELFKEILYLSSFIVFGWILVVLPNGRQSMFRTLLLCAVVVSSIGCVEYFLKYNFFVQFASGHDSAAAASAIKTIAMDKTRDGGFRIQSTFDHPIVFGQFIAGMLPIALLIFRRERSLIWRAISLLLFPLGLFALYKAGTRSGLIGVALFIVVLVFVGWTFLVRGKGFSKAIAFLAMPALFLGLMLAYVVVQELVLGRSRIEAGSSYVRLQMISMGVSALTDSPIFGFGQGSAISKAGIVDRATGVGTIDSLLLSTALDSGYIGLAILLVFLSWFFCVGIKKAISSDPKRSFEIVCIFGAALATFSPFATLSITSNLTFFWLLFAATLPSFVSPRPTVVRT